MAAKEYEIAFKLAGKVAGGFSQTFKQASATVSGMQKSIIDLNRQAAQTDKLVKLKTEVGEAARAYNQARQHVAKLGQEISKTKNPTKEQVAEFNKAEQAVTKAKNALEKKRTTLSKYEESVGSVDGDLKTLTQRQKELADATDRARKAQERYNKLQGNIDASKAAQSGRMDKAKSSMGALAGIAAGATAAAAVPVTTALSFEDQQAELRKFTDDHAQVFSDIKQLTLQYGKSAEDMTAMAANAYQSGIVKTAADAKAIIESQTQAAVAFGMTGDAIGTAWADIQSKMQLDVGATKSVFDLINKLGNETTASSEDIVEVMQRSGGAAKALTKLSEQQVVAMSAAFRSASTSPEVASTSMMSFVNTLTVGANATKSQSEAFEILGLDAIKMAKDMNGSSESAQAAIKTVLSKINELPDEQRASLIGKLFGNEAGIKSAVATLSTNMGMITGNFKTAGDSASYSGSMLAEYQARADTTSESLAIAKNALTLVSNELGQVLLPYVRMAAEALVPLAQKVAEFIQNNQGLVLNILKVVGGLTAFASAFHVLRIAFAFVMAPISKLYQGFNKLRQGITLAKNSTALHTAATKLSAAAQKAWQATLSTGKLIAQKAATAASTVAQKAHTAALKLGAVAQKAWNATLSVAKIVAHKAAMVASKVAMLAWSGVCKAITAAQWLWNAALNANPIGLVIAAIAGLVAAGVALYKNWDTVKAKVKALWDTVKNFFGKIGETISGAWEKAKAFFGGGKKKSVTVTAKGSEGGGVRKMATGGVVTGPTLALVGEGRESEAVLPLSKLDSMLSTRGGGGVSVNFAPVINVSGGNAYEGVSRALNESKRDLKRELERLMAEKQRVSYA